MSSPASPADPTSEEDEHASESDVREQVIDGTPTLGAARLFEPGSAPEMPAVQPHALDAAKRKQEAAKQAASPAGLKDVDGRPFNTAWHQTNPDGSPCMNKDGTVRKLGGRGSPKATGKGPAVNGSAQSRLDTSGPAPQTAAPLPPDENPQTIATAKVSAALTFQIAQMLGGPEFKPEPPEVDSMEQGYLAVYVRYGLTDMPPLAALAAVMFVYATKRWNAPAVVEKRKSIRQWFAHKWVSWRYGSAKKEKKTAATREAHKVDDQVDDRFADEARDMTNGVGVGIAAH